MRKKRLWRRLFFSYLWAPAIVLLAIVWYGSGVVRELYANQLDDDLEARARLCAKPIEDLLSQGRTAEIDALCKNLGDTSHTRITVILPTGEVIGDSNERPDDMDNHGRRPEVLAALEGKVGRARRYSSTEREDRIYAAVPLMRGGAATAAVARASLPVTALTRALAQVRDRIVIAAIFGLLLHAAVTLAISRRMSRPLEEIKAGAERFAAGDLGHRLRIADSVEIDALAATMNRMAEQLDERIRTVLRQQNEREAMLSSMEEGVLAIDNQGTILSLNKACAGLLGDAPERLRGRGVYEVIRKADLLQFIESALDASAPVEGEIRIHGQSERWVSAHGTALHDAQHGKLGVLIVLHDVTRLRHLEEVRRDFVANVSHELRTPITSIKGFIETLADGAIEDKENAQRFLQIMLRQVNRLDAIIADLLTLSRIERGSEEQLIELAPELIKGTLQAAAEMCEKRAVGKSVEIVLSCPDDLSAEINAALLEQAVVNLLDNAVKYSEAGGVVELRAAREGAELTIEVKDHGCGIEARHLPRIFERFYRVDKARSRELGGTGLGLAIVRHIALAHRGSVGVESAVGKGSVFRLRLPASSLDSTG
ncbi:MAG: PAS domain-containing protein [Pirellulaceae bacterium]|nr:PAS domain-containing protein [Pirellulaceae bacterium]